MGNSLSKRTFISTRPSGQNKELRMLIEAEGGKLLEMPTIEIKPAILSLDDEDLIEHINYFSWIVFTSPMGVRFFFEKLNEITGSYDLPSSIKTASVGSKTSQILGDYGYDTTLENPGNTGADLAPELLKAINMEDTILFPEGDLARGHISDVLSKKVDCVNMTVYKNNIPNNLNKDYLKLIITNKYDFIISTSPSSFNNLVKALENKIDLQQLRIISIGTTTTAEVELYGISPATTAQTSSAKGITDAILGIIQNK